MPSKGPSKPHRGFLHKGGRTSLQEEEADHVERTLPGNQAGTQKKRKEFLRSNRKKKKRLRSGTNSEDCYHIQHPDKIGVRARKVKAAS